jgi:hypothetical protein
MNDIYSENEEPVNINDLVGEACITVMENMKPLLSVVNGFFDSGKNLFSFEMKTMDNEWIQNYHLRLMLDVIPYLPVLKHDKYYCFDLFTFTDPSFNSNSQSCHYHIETSLEALPDTGEVTRNQWDLFKSQVKYLKNGHPMEFPVPGEFYDEFDENMETSTPDS